ncbi:MAG: DUF4382 domain-containing protein [Flavobacteriales bacterium]|nr:DUF4382 domain-containing protein [Flavobacteriales bacterium]
MKTIITLFGLAAVMAFTTSCDKNKGEGKMTVRMEDAPYDAEAVFVQVQEVQVKYEDESVGDDGWVSLSTEAGVYNLLELQNGVTAVLTENESIPVGKASQMRLILGTENSIVIDGTTYGLLTSSQTNTGLKFNLNADIQNNENVIVLIDFDVDNSVVLQGTGSYLLKPVIKVEGITYV